MIFPFRDPAAAVPAIDAVESRRLVTEQDALLIDVREPAELAVSGKLAGALAIPVGQIQMHADPDHPAHDPAFRPGRPLILYCRSGQRSGMAGQALKRMGYDPVFNLGSFEAAVAAGAPIEPAWAGS
ncbi:MAG: rhodanese-like domain-containing protein [Alphaproteobacteria bacterium]|nr:rhodanese-like domain-containing protein [Alphaproteobacteria bacterium]MBU2271850.1 rhodanese-like domain-containing protein [Alphaproteobacteria bacterium]MBU2418859.1 rhodanese-like domain-containing protein [Alphaproteobacteria bacterium]